MNKTLYFFVLCLFMSCATRDTTVVVKDVRIGSMRMEESSRIRTDDAETVIEQQNILEETARDSMKGNGILYKRIFHEPPYISADSLAVLRVLWDSVLSSPLLGCERIAVINENGKQTTIYIQAKAATVLLSPFDGRRKTSSALYWEGSTELPANRDAENNSDVLYTWVDNMPTLAITYDEFIEAINNLKELFAINFDVKSKVRFVVEADGSITNAHIIESSIYKMDQLALIVSSYILEYTQPTHRKIPCRVVMELWI